MTTTSALKAAGHGVSRAYRWFGQIFVAESVDPLREDPAVKAQRLEMTKYGKEGMGTAGVDTGGGASL